MLLREGEFIRSRISSAIRSGISENLALLLSIIFVLFVAIAVVCLDAYSYLTSFAIDDALYYPVIARNIASGGGSSFDNLTITNGYHPLWCWLNVPFALLVDNNMTLVWVFKLLVAVVVLCMIFTFACVLRRARINKMTIAIFILLMGGSYWWSIKVYYSGMETPLVTLLIGVSLLVFSQFERQHNIRYSFLLGLALAGTFLARLDSIFYVATFFLYIICKGRQMLRGMLISGLTFVMVTAPYLLWNKIKFGGFIPISGVRKTHGDYGDIVRNLNMLRQSVAEDVQKVAEVINIYVLIALLIVFFLVFFIARSHRRKQPSPVKQYRMFRIVYIGAVIHFVYNVIFMSGMAVNWYQYMLYLSIFLCFAVFASNAFTIRSAKVFRSILFSLTMLGCFLMFIYGLSKFPRQSKVEIVNAALYARDNLESRGIFMMFDPGIFRLVSDRKTVAGNGLIGNRGIMELAMTNRPELIVQEYNVDYLVVLLSEEELGTISVKPIYLTRSFQYANGVCRVGIFDAREYFDKRNTQTGIMKGQGCSITQNRK